MLTIKDIAREARVSTATVSRVLNGVDYRSAETEKRVKDAVEKLGYVTNTSASRLRSGKSNLIGIIISDINNPFYSEIFSYAEQRLKQHDYMMLVTYSYGNPEDERENFLALISAKVSTIFFTPTTAKNRDVISKALDYGINVVQLCCRVYSDIAAIVFDDDYGVYISAEHLIHNGCTRPFLLDISYMYTTDGIYPKRENGLIRAVNEYKIEDYIVSRCIPDVEEYTQDIINNIRSFQPDSIIAGTGLIAVAAISALKRMGLRFPEDIKLVIFDDSVWVSFLEITAIAQPKDEFAEELVSMVIKPNDPHDFLTIVKPKLIVRSSTKDLSVTDQDNCPDMALKASMSQ